MRELWTRFWRDEEGFGTVELVILIGVLVAIALLFRKTIIKFVTDLMNKIFKVGDVPGNTETGG